MARPKIGELELVSRALARLCADPGIQACANVPVLGRCVDLVYLRDSRLFTFEFKIRDWRRAIQQARDHRLAGDYAYVCTPKRAVSPAMRAALLRNGIGLAFCCDDRDEPFEIAIEAPKSNDTWSVARSALVRYITEHHRSTL